MEIRREDREWQKAVNEAIRFVRSTMAIDLLFTGKIIEEELDEEELKNYQRLKDILGKDTIDYLGSKQIGSFSGGGSLPLKTVRREERARQKEYKRIRALSPEELRQEVKKYAAEMREEEKNL